MTKEKICIEYELNTTSINILWNSIGTPLGLAEWFSDGVTVNGDEYVFCWEKYEQTAKLISIKQNSSIKFQWEEDIDSEYFFEIKIEILEVSGHLMLTITDFAEADEKEDMILLWNKQIEQLRRKTGI